ncbi:MAG: polysaccharide deacetylase family protein [Rhodospirillaceae bacterium]
MPACAWRVAPALLALLAWALPVAASAASAAVVIMYHRFGESEYAATNVTIEQLDAHIAELKSGKYAVMPLADIVRRLADGEPLPERAVAITVDDAYRSVYTVAWPKFKAAGLPFTLFASTAHLDKPSPAHMTWEQLREMRAGGVGVGHHTVSHLHMVGVEAERIGEEIAAANERFEKELGFKPGLFAYPYGEAGAREMKMIEKAGFVAAFGQHSGVIGSTESRFYLPRFAMNENYGDLDRLRLALNALPLPVADETPTDHVVGSGANPPGIGFTVARDVGGLEQLACFFSHAGRARLERLGPSRIEVRADRAFPAGRTRLNCTLPGPDRRWRWYGRQFYRP